MYSWADPGAEPFLMRATSIWLDIVRMQARTTRGPDEIVAPRTEEADLAEELPILQIWGIFETLSLARRNMRWPRWRFGLACSQGRRAEQRRLRGDYVTYALCENDIHYPYYVGQTRNLDERIRQHLKHESPDQKVYWHTTSILERGGEIVTCILENTDNREDALASELRWIRRLIDEGHVLMNGNKLPEKPMINRRVSTEVA